MQLRDWLEDLAEFDADLVAAACKEWRRGPEHVRRPLPGDIREICLRRQARNADHRIHCLAIASAREPWPDWLRDLWGPAPEGPRLRAAAIERDRQRRNV